MSQQSEPQNPIFKKIRSRGYWKVVIRPNHYNKSLISNFTTLYPIIAQRAVRLRGWDFPQVEVGSEPERGLDWIAQSSEYDYYLEYWRFYQSGLFVDYSAMTDDWRDQSKFSPPSANWHPGVVLPLNDTVFRYTEIMEFAARIASTELYSTDRMVHVAIEIVGLRNRQIYFDSHRAAPTFQVRQSSIDTFPFILDITRADLIANKRDYALSAAANLFQRFGLQYSPGSLKGIQEELPYLRAIS